MKLNLATFTITFLMLISNVSKAQNTDKFNFGFAYGLSINTVFNHVSQNRGFEPKISPFLFTAFAEYDYKSNLKFTAELEYADKGPKHYQINYLTLSLMPKYRISKQSDIYLLGGIYTGYMFDYLIDGQKINHERLKNYDFGIDTGLDFIFPIYENYEWFVSPRLEIGVIRFSYSNHISLQLKTGLRF